MKIYIRHVFSAFLGLFLLCLSGTVLIFVVIDFVGNSKVWLTRNPNEVYSYYLNYIPHIVYLISPVALLLASVFSIGNLSRHLELVALRSAGLSLWEILFPILLFGVVLSLGMFHFSNTVLPDSNHKRFQINEPRNSENESGDPTEKSNFIYTGSDGSIYYFEYYSGQKKVGQKVTVLVQKAGKLKERYDARSIRWEDKWILADGTRRTFTPDGVKASSFHKKELPSDADRPEHLIDNRNYPDEMRLDAIEQRIRILQRSGESSRLYETQWHFRFSGCWVNFFMVLIGTAMASNTVKQGLARNFGIALFITFLYYVAIRVGLVMGENGSLPPKIGAWFGNLLFAPLGLALLWKAART